MKKLAVFCRGEDDYLHYFYFGDESWSHDGDSFKKYKINGDISSTYNKEQKYSNVSITSVDGTQILYHYVNDAWVCDDSSFTQHKVNGNF
jgi:hypothetical protein